MKNVETLLRHAWAEYSKGKPFMTDAEFDSVSALLEFDEFEEYVGGERLKHMFRMYSLKKVFDDDASPLSVPEKDCIKTPKLDGAAISLQYENGILVSGITRGDGIEGENITDKVYILSTIPNKIRLLGASLQIEGEIVCPKETKNARNYSSGALHLDDQDEFKERAKTLQFIAYGIKIESDDQIETTYEFDMKILEQSCFLTVLEEGLREEFRTDGTVFRVNNNAIYKELGYTSKHPRGAYARKLSSDVESKKTILREVKWQVGRTGKVTPVGVFDPIVIDDANITKATLNNAGFITNMELEIGDTIIVTRSGGIIPKILGKV